MSNYINLPGVNMELMDGNLRVDDSIQGNAVLIVGRAVSGNTNTQYEVRDTNKASRIYDASSPIIKKMDQVRLGGAKRVILYRIGGAPARIEGIFGDGSYIETTEETITAGNKYSLYIGERPTKDGKACLIIFRDKVIVYSNVPGSEVNLGEFIVEGFDANTTVVVGTPTEPVLLSEVILEEKELTLNLTAVSGNEFDLPNTKRAYTVSIVSATVGGAPVLSAGLAVQNSLTSDIKQIKFNADAPVVEDVTVVYKVTPVRSIEGSAAFSGDAALTTFPLQNTKIADQVFVQRVIVAGTDLTEGTDFNLVDSGANKAIEFTTAPALNAAIVVQYSIYQVGQNPPGTYQDGEDNIGASWKKNYELLHAALTDLDVVDAFSVVTDVAILDAPNIADGSTEKDRLEYVHVQEVDGEYKYEWSESKILYKKGSATTADIAEADLNGNGQPIVAKQYHEANFAHLLANFAHNISENEKFCLATIGTSTPKSMTSYEIAKWIGTPPSYDNKGNITINGTGLLGVRNMVDRAENRQGFYKTSTGFVDGPVVYDSNGAPIDIGKYLSVVPAMMYTGTSASIGTDGRITNAAAAYAGLLTTVNPGDSTTNVVIPRVSLPFDVKKTKLDELAGAGYVMLQQKPKGVTVVSGELATNINSDYDYVSTTIIVADVITRIRNIADNYIGKGLTEATTAALETAIESEFQTMVSAGSVNKYLFSVIVGQTINGKGVLDIPITIVPPFELREVNVAMKLAMDL